MDGAQEFVGLGGDDGAGPDNIAARVPPRVPKSCKGKEFSDFITTRMDLLAFPTLCHS